MTNERIAEIKVLCEAATPGPWLNEGHCLFGPEHGLSRYTNKRIFLGRTAAGSNRRDPALEGGSTLDMPGDGDSDANFIAAARQIIPELLEALEHEKTSSDLLFNALKDQAERGNSYKTRAEALERAIYEFAPCLTCIRETPGNIETCGNCEIWLEGPGVKGWHFDEDRFANP